MRALVMRRSYEGRCGNGADPGELTHAAWLAQWEEMLLDKEQKIARPRQIYTGYDERPYVSRLTL